MEIGNNIRRCDVLPSTNSLLKAEAEMGLAQEGAVIVAEHQTAGRGRFDRQWESPPGKGLLFSILLSPDLKSDRMQLIGLMASLGVVDGVEELINAECPPSASNHNSSSVHLQLKWPNDILVDGKKLCGILCETSCDPDGRRFVVAGIGLNVNQSEDDFPPWLRRTANSLYIITKQTQPREKLLGLILSYIDLYYRKTVREGCG